MLLTKINPSLTPRINAQKMIRELNDRKEVLVGYTREIEKMKRTIQTQGDVKNQEFDTIGSMERTRDKIIANIKAGEAMLASYLNEHNLDKDGNTLQTKEQNRQEVQDLNL